MPWLFWCPCDEVKVCSEIGLASGWFRRACAVLWAVLRWWFMGEKETTSGACIWRNPKSVEFTTNRGEPGSLGRL